jgi:alpha-tubulin suppressor-like RCC1 family protein
MFGAKDFFFTRPVAGGGGGGGTDPGYLWAWGRNNYGQLGLGNATDYSSPKQIGALSTWQFVGSGMGYFASEVIKSDNSLWVWGSGGYGKLGLGNSTSYSSPKQVGSLTTWASPASGFSQATKSAAAIKTDGTLWTWGQGYNGQLGLGVRTNYSSPKQVGGLTNWASVSIGSKAMVAVKTDGTLWSWGYNTSYGQLGLGNTINYSSPKQVGALTNWSKVSFGNESVLAIKTNGTLWGWGNNQNGRLGTNNQTSFSSPVQIGALTNWESVSCGYQQTLAIKTDKTLWAWGTNSYGQLGIGDIARRLSPVQVGSDTNWQKVSTSNKSTIATKTNGTLWTWGRNNYGQLGKGNTTDYSSPVQVGALTSWQDIGIMQYFTLAVKK